jgi:diguanylate cyclase (GGDEF)-like protein
MNWLISKSQRDNSQFAVIFIDLDNFKNINDTRGHEFGDVVLQKVSSTILKAVRDNDIVARFGGDEFVVLIPNITNETPVIEVVQRIKKHLLTPIEHEGFSYIVTASIGIAFYPKDGKDASTLLKNADIAMYKSKELGRNKYHFFTEKLNDVIQEKMFIQRLMVDALEKGHFHLYYQPKVDITTKKIVSCEALIRLIDPHHGLIPPNKFISIAEENGFIVLLGKWILQEAAKQIKKWQNTPLANIQVSINVSSVQFQEKHFLEYLQEVAQEIDPRLLDLEITESVLMDNIEESLKTIDTIKNIGITFSLDDFGTGYSSLSYLKKIPFNTIKIDKSFIDDLENAQDKAFV